MSLGVMLGFYDAARRLVAEQRVEYPEGAAYLTVGYDVDGEPVDSVPTVPEVIAPGAFDKSLPAEVPVTNTIGKRIGTANVNKADQGLTVELTFAPGSERFLSGEYGAGYSVRVEPTDDGFRTST